MVKAHLHQKLPSSWFVTKSTTALMSGTEIAVTVQCEDPVSQTERLRPPDDLMATVCDLGGTNTTSLLLQECNSRLSPCVRIPCQIPAIAIPYLSGVCEDGAEVGGGYESEIR